MSHDKRRGEKCKPIIQLTIHTMAKTSLFILYTSFYLVLKAVPCIIVIIILQIRNWDSERLSNLFRTTLPANDKAMTDN